MTAGIPSTFPLTVPALVRYHKNVTAKSVTWFSSQTLGGPPATNLLIGGFFASAVWLCSFWASRAGSLTARRFLVSGLLTCLDSPIFRLAAENWREIIPSITRKKP